MFVLKMAMAIMAIMAKNCHYGMMAMAIFKSNMALCDIPEKSNKKLNHW